MPYVYIGARINGTVDALLSDLVYLVYTVYRIEKQCK